MKNKFARLMLGLSVLYPHGSSAADDLERVKALLIEATTKTGSSDHLYGSSVELLDSTNPQNAPGDPRGSELDSKVRETGDPSR